MKRAGKGKGGDEIAWDFADCSVDFGFVLGKVNKTLRHCKTLSTEAYDGLE